MYNDKFVTQIVAVNNKGVIGKDDQLLWHNKEDLAHFKKTTMWNTLIVGRKTASTLPKAVSVGRVLFEVSRSGLSVDEAFEKASKIANNDNIFVIGGGQIYKETFKYTDYILLSRIDDNQDGDTFYEVPEGFELTTSHKYETFTLEIWSKKREGVSLATETDESCAITQDILTGTFELTI